MFAGSDWNPTFADEKSVLQPPKLDKWTSACCSHSHRNLPRNSTQQNWGCKQGEFHQQILVDVCNIIHIGHIFVNLGFPDKHGNQPVRTKKMLPMLQWPVREVANIRFGIEMDRNTLPKWP
jgi:hypothetical protein